MNVSVTYDDSDVAKALEKIIVDKNSGEFVKLFTPMICQSSHASNWLFKLMLGNELPEIIPTGTLCKFRVDNLSYGVNKEAVRNKYADAEDKVVVTIREFRGFHDYTHYLINYTNVDEHGQDKPDYCSAQANQLEIIKEI
jgi:hypothetical protein